MTGPRGYGLFHCIAMMPAPPRRALSRRPIVLAMAILIAAVSPAASLVCGDDVEGVDVPCRCGDIVVSDLVLTDDPILSEPCDRDGLIVRARPDAPAVTIDLAGHRLRGLGRGVGIRVLHGGLGGVRIVSGAGPARIDGFRDGLVSESHRFGVVEVLDLEIQGVGRDGVRIFGDGLLLRNIVVTGAGRDGVFVRGAGWTIEDIVAQGNGRHGVGIMGAGHTIRPGSTRHSVRAEGNRGDGVRLWGSDHRLRSCRSASNVGDGVAVNGARLDLTGCDVRANAKAGIAGMATSTRFIDNRAWDNLGGGIVVHGHTLLDGGGNVAQGNGAGHLRSGECRLGLEECR